MTLLTEVSGQKGENLCSTVLGHILMRCPEARELLISLISDISPGGPIYVQNQFAVFREERTSDSETSGDATSNKSGSRHGRLDLTIETDDAVIGIENKFNAPFQENQPQGYLEHLRKRADALERLRGRSFSYLLVVLAPASRENEVRQKIKEQNIEELCQFLSWQSLLTKFDQLRTASPIDGFLIQELKTYAYEQIGSLADLERLLPHLLRPWKPRGRGSQQRFISNFFWSLLDESVRRNSTFGGGIQHYGYFFYRRPGDAGCIWIGFIDRMSFMRESNPSEGSALIICVSPDARSVKLPESDNFVEVSVHNWTDRGWRCTELKFNESDTQWKNVQRWTDALVPINEIFRH